jgi:hypothetical protein
MTADEVIERLKEVAPENLPEGKDRYHRFLLEMEVEGYVFLLDQNNRIMIIPPAKTTSELAEERAQKRREQEEREKA